MKKNVLVFPCGSEIALEIYRSLKYSTHFNLIGANSVDDHGRFVYENYIGGLPFITEGTFVEKFKKLIETYKIDIIYPAMDSVITILKCHESEFGCPVVCSPLHTTQICLSKELTYNKLKDVVIVPKVYELSDSHLYPVFVKPKIGYGSRGAKKIETKLALESHFSEYNDLIVTEFLTGDEYTVDCFTDRKGVLRFCGARKRNRISNGISVNTFPVEDHTNEFGLIASKINSNLEFRGAWFFQVKRNADGDLVLLEIASRLGGSSSLFRARGINFAMLSLFDLQDLDVDLFENNYDVELDRALDNKYKLKVSYNEVFIDFDDCLFLDENLYNADLMRFVFVCLNRKIKLTILSRHKGNLQQKLDQLKIGILFDRIIHIDKDRKKSDYIDNLNSIFIDDSFAERKDVNLVHKIPVFSPDMIETLM